MSTKRITYFTPGPVEMDDAISAIGGTQVPYFRNQQFSDVVLECERYLLEFTNAPAGSRAVMLASSGTGGIEAAIANFASSTMPSLVINTRGFGQRFVDICNALGRPVREFKLPLGESFKRRHAALLEVEGCGAIFCNAHDTISGVWNDVGAAGELAKDKGRLFVVDAISSFLCDPIDMAESGIDVFITGSQKALGLAPGLAVIVLSPRALKKLNADAHAPGTYYFDLKPYVSNGARGQTPFTPAVSVIYQMQARLRQVADLGVENVLERTGQLAAHFRTRLNQGNLPFRTYPDIASNAVTAIEVLDSRLDADKIVSDFARDYGLFLTPNGGELKHSVFRVSHMGVQTTEALDELIDILADYANKMESGSR